jgi:hypothetical protein
MTETMLPRMNGSPFHSAPNWMRQNVQQFFCNFNWDDTSPRIQAWIQTTTTDEQPLSLTLKVKQFFEMVNWDGGAIGVIGQFQVSQPETVSPPSSLFTLDDFSELF